MDNYSDPLNITTDNILESSPALSHRLTIKLPRMAANGAGPIAGLRRSTRRTRSENSMPSGSEYHESEKSMEVDLDADAEGDEEVPSPEPKVEYTTTGRGRKIQKKSYIESESDADPLGLNNIFSEDNKPVRYGGNEGDDEDEDDIGPRRPRRTRNSSQMNGFIVSDDEQPGGRYPTRSRSKKPPPKTKPSTSNGRSRVDVQRAARQARRARRSAKAEQEEDGYIDEEQSPSSPDGEFDDVPRTSSEIEDIGPDGEGDGEEAEQEGRPYALRQRAKINYAIPPPLEEMKPVAKGGASRSARNGGGGGRNGGARPGARRGPGWSATGAELGRWMGMPGDDSVSVLVVVALYSDSCLTRTRTTIPVHHGNRLEAFTAVLLLRVVLGVCYLAIWLLLLWAPHRISARSGMLVGISCHLFTVWTPIVLYLCSSFGRC